MTFALIHRLPLPRIAWRGEQLVPCARREYAAPELSKRAGRMNDAGLQIAMWVIGGLGLTIVGGLCGIVIMLLNRNADRSERRDDGRDQEFGQARERLNDKQSQARETIAGVSARVDALQTIVEKVADAITRISRLEEWRMSAGERLDHADKTGREVIALGEQTKSIFRRMDVFEAKMDEIRHEQADTPRRTAELLRTMIKPIEPVRRAANG